MRFAAPLCALVFALSLPVTARAALGVEAVSSDRPAVEASNFKEGDPQHYEKERNFRLQEQRRSTMKGQARGIALIVAPVALLVLVTFLFAKARNSQQSRKRSTHRKMKQAEVRRRSGGPEQVVDPRQW